MSWDGYFELDGVEIINVSRTEAYAKGMPWFKPLFGNPFLATMLGHREYRTPLQDDPPWADPDDIDSYDFLGVYPLSVEGIDSSTRSATVIESTVDGGVAGSVRHGTKQMPFNVALVAASEAGAVYGAKWLRMALNGSVCGPGGGFGGALCYLSSEPLMEPLSDIPDGAQYAVLSGGSASMQADTPLLEGGNAATTVTEEQFTGGDADDPVPLLLRSTSIFDAESDTTPEDCLTPYLRSLRKTTVITGPTVTSRRTLRSGGAVWTATFTIVAGSPFEVGPELEVVRGFLDPDVEVPWASGTAPDGASIDLDGFLVPDESECYPPLVQPLYDPLNPAILLPPSVPSVPLGYFDPPVNWQRRMFTIPRQYIPLWGEVVPKVTIHTKDADLRSLRLRFYADPFEVGDIADDPCAFCGDIIVSYIPQGYSMTLDGVEETVTVVGPGGVEQRADSLVFSSDGTPFDWPVLSCGFGYVVTLDLPKTAPTPVVDLSLFERSRG